MRLSCWFRIAALTLFALPCFCQDTLQLVYYTPLNVDLTANTASTVLQLRNPNAAALKYVLSFEDFKSTNRPGVPLGSVATFTADGKVSVGMLVGNAPAGSDPFSVKVDFTHVIEVGNSTAKLICNKKEIGILTALRQPAVPLKVTLDGSPPEKPELPFFSGQNVDLHLRNDDITSYPISWELIVRGKSVKNFVSVPAGGSATITVTPDPGWFSAFQSFFKPETADGELILRYDPAKGQSSDAAPAKTIPVKADLSSRPAGATSLWSALVILLILAAGGAFSSYLNVDLVNRLRMMGIKKRLDQLARTIGEIAPQLDSHLRVVLLLERKRISAVLPHGVLFTPETAAGLAQSDTDTKALEARVALASQIADTLVLESKCEAEMAPSLKDRVDLSLSRAQDVIRKAMLTDVELQKASALVSDAINILEGLGTPDPTLENDLVQRLQDLTAKFTAAVLADPICSAIKAAAPVPFGLLAGGAAQFETQARRDANSRKLEVVYDIDQMGVPPDPEMMDDLKRQDFGSLRSAELLLSEAKEEIGFADLQAAIQANQLSIRIDRDQVRVNQPVLMQVVFNDPRYGQASAKRLIYCKWSFGHDNLTEKGWEVCHYFPKRASYTVSVTFFDEKQNAIQPAKPVTLPVKVDVQPVKSYAQSVVEFQRWLAGFFVAIIGLFAGAKDKILTLDTLGVIIAVFLLGFSIDMAKNLLVPKPQ